MKQSRKRLKISSLIVLLFAGLTLLQLVSEILLGELNSAEIPVDAPENILLITKIFLLVMSVVLLLPQIYIGVKGLKVAKNPSAAKAHIIVAIILFVLAISNLVFPALSIIKGDDIGGNVLTVLSVAVEIMVFFDYITAAREVAKAKR